MITTINNKNYHIDIPGNRITFLDSRWYYSENGVPVPSVTTVLDAYPKGFGFYKWLKENGENSDELRDEAGRKGSTVHRLTEDYDNGLEVSFLNEGAKGDLNISTTEWKWFERYVEFCDRYPHENEAIEINLISEALGYAGTIDRLKVFDLGIGKNRILTDIKTGGYQSDTWWLQLAAYKRLAQAHNIDIDDVAILWLNAKTKGENKRDKSCWQGDGWQWCRRSQEEQKKDLQLFDHTHALWLAQNEGLRPKQISYQLTHKK
jgi:hypothetical protein